MAVSLRRMTSVPCRLRNSSEVCRIRGLYIELNVGALQNIVNQTKANEEAAAQAALDGMKPTKASGALPKITLPAPGATGKRRNRWDQTGAAAPECVSVSGQTLRPCLIWCVPVAVVVASWQCPLSLRKVQFKRDWLILVTGATCSCNGARSLDYLSSPNQQLYGCTMQKEGKDLRLGCR